VKTNTIICGDNVQELLKFPAECIDLVVTSPPYDELRDYGGHTWDFERLAYHLCRVLKPGGVIVWIVGDATVDGSETGTSFKQALFFKELGLRLHDTMIYHRQAANPSNVHGRYWQNFEFMFVLSKGSPKSINLLRDKPNTQRGMGGTTNRNRDGSMSPVRKCAPVKFDSMGYRSNIWHIAATGGSNMGEGVGNHPAVFPESLARDHILSWSNEGDIVLDPFAGSFTTCRMAKNEGRQWIGIEVSEEYCEIGRKRMSQQVFDFSSI